MLPAYIKIHDQIKKDIDDAVWEIGERLPSERDLAETFKVSRMTLRQAITLLVEEGVLERRVGSQHTCSGENAWHHQLHGNHEGARQNAIQSAHFLSTHSAE